MLSSPLLRIRWKKRLSPLGGPQQLTPARMRLAKASRAALALSEAVRRITSRSDPPIRFAAAGGPTAIRLTWKAWISWSMQSIFARADDGWGNSRW